MLNIFPTILFIYLYRGLLSDSKEEGKWSRKEGGMAHGSLFFLLQKSTSLIKEEVDLVNGPTIIQNNGIKYILCLLYVKNNFGRLLSFVL